MSNFIFFGFLSIVEPFSLSTPNLHCYKKGDKGYVIKEDVLNYFNITETKLTSLIRTHRLLDEEDFYITADSFVNLYKIYKKYRQEDRRCGQSNFPSIAYIKKEGKTK